MKPILRPSDPIANLVASGGGKATNLARLAAIPGQKVSVPPWFCLTAELFDEFVRISKIDVEGLVDPKNLQATHGRIEEAFLTTPMPAVVSGAIRNGLRELGLSDAFVAVRSSGLDEDSAEHSFAGQYSSYLFQKGEEAILASVRRCWASAYSERALAYRTRHGLPIRGLRMGVLVQEMIGADSSGVAFSRDPMHPLDRDAVVVSSVWGLGEGLVSGELDADHFNFSRAKKLILTSRTAAKTECYRQAPEGGIALVALPADKKTILSLTQEQVRDVAELVISLESALGAPQDCEWAFRGGELFCLQTRPITTLPPAAFYDEAIRGAAPILWDNSNIIESYSGVTSPLTFTFARMAYEQVYIQFCQVIGVPSSLTTSHEYESVFRNMLGLIRGRVYYNLINWYKLVLVLPGSASNKAFMETMMGVKQGLRPELTELFEFVRRPPRYSLAKKLGLVGMTYWRFHNRKKIVSRFMNGFDEVYDGARKLNFRKMSLSEQLELYFKLRNQLLLKWHAPIINDYLCMIFFGLLKKLTANWLGGGAEGSSESLQNDLLCGQGDLESTEPTKMLMRIAAIVDRGPAGQRQKFLETPAERLWDEMQRGELPGLAVVTVMMREFLDRYGFRCVNELKLEEPDLHDSPAFVINAVQGYIRMKSYSIAEMEKRERVIRDAAEQQVRSRLSGVRLSFYLWVVQRAREAVKNRENMRFARTKIFGIVRHLFRAMGGHLERLGTLEKEHHVFYLTLDELISYIEGRGASLDLSAVAKSRFAEFDKYRAEPGLPSRLLTFGAAGASFAHVEVVQDADLLRGEEGPAEPGVLRGTPCCPGVVEGVVRVARNLKDAEDLNGEILVTERTDPGWVPLYPNCSCLLIERGSLLSHSAVVARELGLPTIVGINGGLLNRLETGMRVRVDAGKGEIRIISRS